MNPEAYLKENPETYFAEWKPGARSTQGTISIQEALDSLAAGYSEADIKRLKLAFDRSLPPLSFPKELLRDTDWYWSAKRDSIESVEWRIAQLKDKMRELRHSYVACPFLLNGPSCPRKCDSLTKKLNAYELALFERRSSKSAE